MDDTGVRLRDQRKGTLARRVFWSLRQAPATSIDVWGIFAALKRRDRKGLTCVQLGIYSGLGDTLGNRRGWRRAGAGRRLQQR